MTRISRLSLFIVLFLLVAMASARALRQRNSCDVEAVDLVRQVVASERFVTISGPSEWGDSLNWPDGRFMIIERADGRVPRIQLRNSQPCRKARSPIRDGSPSRRTPLIRRQQEVHSCLHCVDEDGRYVWRQVRFRRRCRSSDDQNRPIKIPSRVELAVATLVRAHRNIVLAGESGALEVFGRIGSGFRHGPGLSRPSDYGRHFASLAGCAGQARADPISDSSNVTARIESPKISIMPAASRRGDGDGAAVAHRLEAISATKHRFCQAAPTALRYATVVRSNRRTGWQKNAALRAARRIDDA